MQAARRRIGGWGFEGEALRPSSALLAWLEARIGRCEPASCDLPEAAGIPNGAPLPDLPALVGRDGSDRLAHARGQGLPDLLRLRSGRLPAVPDAVVRPADGEEVAGTLQACAAAGIRVIPWGGGTSVTGGVNVPSDGRPTISLDLGRLSGLYMLDERSGLARFGAGTLGPAIERALGERGFTLGHFPQSFELSTLGGWAVTRSSGQESLGFGGIAELVAGLELIAPAGRLSIAAMPSSAAGPDLRQLVLGSEGRLGVVGEVTVRVRPLPAARSVDAYLLPNWASGSGVVKQLVQGGVGLALLRLSDRAETEVALSVGLGSHRFAGVLRRGLELRGVGAGCLLLCGAVGTRRCVRGRLSIAGELVRGAGGVSLGGAPGRRWLADRFRHPYLRDGLLDAGVATETLETAAPWSRLEALRQAVTAALAEPLDDARGPALLCHLSHPYRDGASLYFTFFFPCPTDSDAAVERWAAFKRRATQAIRDAGGTLSHHHGVGQWHSPWLPSEVGEAGVRLLTAVARTMDPQGVLNPQVLLDPGIDLREA